MNELETEIEINENRAEGTCFIPELFTHKPTSAGAQYKKYLAIRLYTRCIKAGVAQYITEKPA